MSQLKVKIYPNPAANWLTIEGSYDNLFVLDITGRPVLYDLQNEGDRKKLFFANRNKGLIFIIMEIDGKRIVRKVILTP